MSARILPRPIRSFGRGMMSKRTIGTIGKILIPSSISGIIFGVLFNEYFGVVLPFYNPVLNVVAELPILLIITVFVGLGHVTLGYFYGIYNSLKVHRMKHVYAKIGWLLLLWSATLALMVFFGRGLFPSPNIVMYASLGVFVTSLGIIAVNEGGRFAMEIPTLISHVMSYARILGVLLASVLLASIADSSLAGSFATARILSIAFVLVIVLLTHLLNIVLGIFEPSIQAARLHYVEFYTKFFEGNGRPFLPFRARRSLTKAAKVQ